MSKGINFQFDFDGELPFQIKAVDSVIQIFDGQPMGNEASSSMLSANINGTGWLINDDGIIGNAISDTIPFLDNIQRVQRENNVQESTKLEPCTFNVDGRTESMPLNFTIEMETGTGKTYTYIRTVYKLNEIYGFKKFVIVVPSVAIREGVMQSLQDTQSHFQRLFGNPPVNFMLYDSSKKTQLPQYARANAIQILVINIDSFTQDSNIINKPNENGVIPIQLIQNCNPIVIVDEPQNMETDTRKSAIANLNPICTLRYSATHKDYYNLLYSLNPVQAYELGLVKQIEVDGITVDREDYNGAYIELNDVLQQGKKGIKAKVTIYVNEDSGVKKKNIQVGLLDDLFDKSGGREMYSNGFEVIRIDLSENSLTFANKLTLYKGEQRGGMADEVMKFQIERTLINHFEKERNLKSKKIKVLSLFFIDRVANYRDSEGNPGKFAVWFEELFNRLAPKNYPYTAEQVHDGYFSQDKGQYKDTKDGEKKTKADNEAYEKIMRNKKLLLDESEPLRFIFSHSALREGWDNPNVFQICTLNETQSIIKKRQEIGRGMRLPVNYKGERCWDKNINILTVIANESYADFSAALQKEIEDETSVTFTGRILDKREKVSMKLSKELTPENFPDFFALWDKIKYQTQYRVEYNTEELIKNAIGAVSNMPKTYRPLLKFEKAGIDIKTEGIKSDVWVQDSRTLQRKEYTIPDIFAYIQSKISISKKTIAAILKGSKRLNEIYINPQMFLDNVIVAIKGELNRLLVEGIEYIKISGKEYEMGLLQDNEEVKRYLSNVKPVTRPEKTLYNYIETDSTTEELFAEACQTNTKVKFFWKLPKRGFHIPTPIGSYSPDWAIVFESDCKIYFVAETKSTLNRQERREEENMKIDCGKKWSVIVPDLTYTDCTKLSELVEKIESDHLVEVQKGNRMFVEN